MKIPHLRISLLFAASALLTSCGGSSSSSAPADASAASPTFGDCFALTAGKNFVRTDGTKILIVQETFEGQVASGIAELRADDTRFGVLYQSISGGYVNFLGIAQYDQNGAAKGKNVYSAGYRLPVDMAPGQTVQVNYVDTQTMNGPPLTTNVTNETEAFTFVGFENLTLGGRTFANACKISTPDSVAGQSVVTWASEGFGTIRRERQDALGNTLPGTRNELTTIIAAP